MTARQRRSAWYGCGGDRVRTLWLRPKGSRFTGSCGTGEPRHDPPRYLGIPHILADSEEAAALGFGFAQAEDHAAEIGRRYLAARGEAARHFGGAAIADDLAIAQFDNMAAARRAVQTISPLYRRIISAYAAGVNRYVAAHRQELPSWMPEITAADVLACTRSSAAESLAGPALLRRLRESFTKESSRHATRRTAAGSTRPDPMPWRSAARARRLASRCCSAIRTCNGGRVLGGARPCAWGDRLLWIDAARDPGRPRRVQRPSRIRHDEQRPGPRGRGPHCGSIRAIQTTIFSTASRCLSSAARSPSRCGTPTARSGPKAARSGPLTWARSSTAPRNARSR